MSCCFGAEIFLHDKADVSRPVSFAARQCPNRIYNVSYLSIQIGLANNNDVWVYCVGSVLKSTCGARCGRVMNVTVARDLQGKPKGFAHVEFSNELEAQNALSLSGKRHLCWFSSSVTRHLTSEQAVAYVALTVAGAFCKGVRCPCRLHAPEPGHHSHAKGQQAARALCAAWVRGGCPRPRPGARLLWQPRPSRLPWRLHTALRRALPLPRARQGPAGAADQQQVRAARAERPAWHRAQRNCSGTNA